MANVKVENPVRNKFDSMELPKANNYTNAQFKDNPQNYLRAAVIHELSRKRNALNTTKPQLPQLAERDAKSAIGYAEQALKHNPTEQNAAHYIIGLECAYLGLTYYNYSSAKKNLKIATKHLQSITRSDDSQPSLVENDKQKEEEEDDRSVFQGFDFYPQAQYLLGIIYQKENKPLKAMVAYIKSTLSGYPQAANKLKKFLDFAVNQASDTEKSESYSVTSESTAENNKFTITVKKNNATIYFKKDGERGNVLSVYRRYKLVQALHADDVIEKDDYVESLTQLSIELRSLKNSEHNTLLVKIEKQIILNSRKDDQRKDTFIGIAGNNHLMGTRKAKDLNSFVSKNAKKSRRQQAHQAGKTATKGAFEDYKNALKKPVLWTAAIGGWALGWPVGLAEYATVIGIMWKLVYSLDQPTPGGYNSDERYPTVAGFYNSINIGGYVEKSYAPDVSDSGFAWIASMIGRGIGFVVATVVAAVVSVIAYPSYLLHRYRTAYAENYKQNNPQDVDAKDIQYISAENLALAANKSLNTKGENSKKTYQTFFEGILKPDEALKEAPKPSAPSSSIDEFEKHPPATATSGSTGTQTYPSIPNSIDGEESEDASNRHPCNPF